MEATDVEAGMRVAADADAAPLTTMSVVRGQPTAEEVAALVAVIAGCAAASAAADSARRAHGAPVSAWIDRARYVRGRLPHSPDGWRAAALPR